MKKLASKGLLMSALICGNVLLGGNAVFAEEVHEYDLDAMVVTATRTMKQIQEVPSSVSVVTAKDIEERNITSVPEALQTLCIKVKQFKAVFSLEALALVIFLY